MTKNERMYFNRVKRLEKKNASLEEELRIAKKDLMSTERAMARLYLKTSNEALMEESMGVIVKRNVLDFE